VRRVLTAYLCSNFFTLVFVAFPVVAKARAGSGVCARVCVCVCVCLRNLCGFSVSLRGGRAFAKFFVRDARACGVAGAVRSACACAPARSCVR
jgi:hypothetical protein